MTIKRVNHQVDPAQHEIFVSGGAVPAITQCFQGYQITDTESHPEWTRRRKGRFHMDIGGPFYTKKWESFVNTLGSTSRRFKEGQEFPAWPDGRLEYDNTFSGAVLPLPPDQMSYGNLIESDDNSLDRFGTEAIAQCSPSNSSVDLSVAIGELFKEGIPALIGGTLKTWKGLSGRDRRRAIGQEYLNYEFGWKPLVNDLLGFCSGVISAHNVFQAYERNSGKMVRRQYDFPEQTSTDIQVVASNVSPWYSPSSTLVEVPGTSGLGTVYRSDKLTIRRWFRGAFCYYVPPISDDLTDEMARAFIYARKTLGISLTPDTIWNLTPWSWAVDWFGNTGDVLSNWTDWAIDNQVLMYGYIMEHKRHERTYTYAGPSNLDGCIPNDVTLVVETKVRRPATPYGFGFRWEDFSDRQKTIVAALGISRTR